MGIRDKELERLIHYAKGLGIDITILPYVPYSLESGTCTTDGTEIDIFESKRDSKIEIILTIIHELGHYMYYVHTNNRAPDPKLEEALGAEEEKYKYRKIIYQHEVDSAAYWDVIYKETGMSFPYKRLEMQKEFDLWQYEVYLATGKSPTKKQKINKRKALRRKYARKET